jgi:hypothetical protein
VTREQQKSITEFVARTVSADHPPMDIEADAIIRALFARNPDAAYRITMLAMALTDAQVAQAKIARANGKGLLSALFGKKDQAGAITP